MLNGCFSLNDYIEIMDIYILLSISAHSCFYKYHITTDYQHGPNQDDCPQTGRGRP